jgi:segregation and condensation protein B
VSPEDRSDGAPGGGPDGFWAGDEPQDESLKGKGVDGAEFSEWQQPPGPLTANAKMNVVEALLFVSPEPLSVGMLAEITGFDQGAVREILNNLVDSYGGRSGGLVVREVAQGFGFYATPEAAPYISRLIRSQVNPRLTRAAMETLAIVAYLQPVSRGVVAEIRGVHSEGVMKTLEERGLVKEVGRGGPPGYPMLYGTTGRFMERFGLKTLEDLPDLSDFAPDDATIEKIKRSLSWELIEEDAGGGGVSEIGEDSEDTVGSGDSLTEGGGEADPGGPGDPEWS